MNKEIEWLDKIKANEDKYYNEYITETFHIGNTGTYHVWNTHPGFNTTVTLAMPDNTYIGQEYLQDQQQLANQQGMQQQMQTQVQMNEQAMGLQNYIINTAGMIQYRNNGGGTNG